MMAQDDQSLDRLESALERIGRHIEQPDPVATDVARRLDAVIAQLRAGLAEQGGVQPGLDNGEE